jgi:hypothetical protein
MKQGFNKCKVKEHGSEELSPMLAPIMLGKLYGQEDEVNLH